MLGFIKSTYHSQLCQQGPVLHKWGSSGGFTNLGFFLLVIKLLKQSYSPYSPNMEPQVKLLFKMFKERYKTKCENDNLIGLL